MAGNDIWGFDGEQLMEEEDDDPEEEPSEEDDDPEELEGEESTVAESMEVAKSAPKYESDSEGSVNGPLVQKSIYDEEARMMDEIAWLEESIEEKDLELEDKNRKISFACGILGKKTDIVVRGIDKFINTERSAPIEPKVVEEFLKAIRFRLVNTRDQIANLFEKD